MRKRFSLKYRKQISKRMMGNKRNLGNKLSDETKKKISEAIFKGENASYFAIHMWILDHRGNPLKCEPCGILGKKVGRKWNIDWANIDHKYRRVFEDYIGMCRKCHGAYDKKNKLRKHYEYKKYKNKKLQK